MGTSFVTTQMKIRKYKETTLLSPEGRPLIVYFNTLTELPAPPTDEFSALFDPLTLNLYFSKDGEWNVDNTSQPDL